MAPSKTDTFEFRTSGSIGFNARVEPVFASVELLKDDAGKFEFWKKKRALKKVIRSIDDGLAHQGIRGGGWYGQGEKTHAHLRVARLGVMEELKEYARLRMEHREGPFFHIISHGRGCYYLPIDFPKPFAVPGEDGETRIAVGSAPRLQEELEILNETLHVEENFQLKKMVDFLDATQDDILKFETRFDDDMFWTNFAFILLRKLCLRSQESGCPILFA